ncbi:unnamed protein product, partial [Rotaria sp. Silwood2]
MRLLLLDNKNVLIVDDDDDDGSYSFSSVELGSSTTNTIKSNESFTLKFLPWGQILLFDDMNRTRSI